MYLKADWWFYRRFRRWGQECSAGKLLSSLGFGYIRDILGMYWYNGNEHGNYQLFRVQGLGLRVLGF